VKASDLKRELLASDHAVALAYMVALEAEAERLREELMAAYQAASTRIALPVERLASDNYVLRHILANIKHTITLTLQGAALGEEGNVGDWKRYRRTADVEMRAFWMGDSLEGVSVSVPDQVWLDECVKHGHAPGGYIARNPANHADQWYVAQAYAEANFDLENPLPTTGGDE
jgi:hypothetical protein